MDEDQIKQLRKDLGWTQLEMANELGCEPVTISRWERGTHKPSNAYVEKLLKLSEV